jgi:hypothetical protein
LKDPTDHSYIEVIVVFGVYEVRASQADRYIKITVIPEAVTSRVDCIKRALKEKLEI